MSNFDFPLPTAELEKERNEILKSIRDKIDYKAKEIEVASMDMVHDIIARNDAELFFNPGDSFLVHHSKYKDAYWRILNNNSGDIYNGSYTGDIVVNQDKLVPITGRLNDFTLQYKRYSTDATEMSPLANDLLEVRWINKNGSKYNYDTSTGNITFDTAPIADERIDVEVIANGARHTVYLFPDGSSRVFSLAVETVIPSEIISVNMVTNNYTYTGNSLHIEDSHYELPITDVIYASYKTTKPSLTINMIDCITQKIRFKEEFKANKNNYKYCDLRQLLNARTASGTWFKPQYAGQPTPTMASEDGFMYGLDDNFKKYIGKALKRSAIGSGSNYVETIDDVFILSLGELNASHKVTDRIYKFYNDLMGDELLNARIKYSGTALVIWHQRDLDTTSAAYKMTGTGTVNSSPTPADSTSGFGVSPSCLII